MRVGSSKQGLRDNCYWTGLDWILDWILDTGYWLFQRKKTGDVLWLKLTCVRCCASAKREQTWDETQSVWCCGECERVRSSHEEAMLMML